MTSPQQRRDPQPMSRGAEVALVVLAGVLMLLGLAALVGLGAAAALVGGGWAWPHGSDTIGKVLGGCWPATQGRACRRSWPTGCPGRSRCTAASPSPSW